MLRITVSKNEANAKNYFDNELSRGDYYIGDETIKGEWHGKCAEMLNLNGVVTKDAFYRLCENKHPHIEKNLTQKTTTKERRILYDCTFSVPKSVSILWGLTRSEKILSTFHDAVKATMQEMEESMQVRVRVKEQDHDRTTGNMVYAMFTHNTARPVDGKSDMHLHAHCTAFNVSFDQEERKFKAAQFGEIKKDAPYYQAAFMNRLACGIKDLGFGIETTPKGQFEIAGFSKELIEKFSRRSQDINRIAKELGITNEKQKAELGAKTRKSKLKEDSFSKLQREWVSRLSESDKKVLSELDKHKDKHNSNDLGKSYDYAVNHCFERRSVLTEKGLWEAVLKQGVGALTVADVKEYVHPKILKGKDKDVAVVSTVDVLNDENKMLDLARESKGTCAPLNRNEAFFEKLETSILNVQQKQAVKYLLSSTCRIDILSGGAGVGKTTAMTELKKGIEEGGKSVYALAPTAGAADVLTKEGFTSATLQRFLIDRKLQEQMKGNVVILDEAGIVSTKGMKDLFLITKQNDIRLILSGDTKQHTSVERGDAMSLLQRTGVLNSQRIETVIRQRGEYKDAVQYISQGNLMKGFEILDKGLGWVKEHDPKEIYEKIAGEYVKDIKAKKTAPLVIAPTHMEADKITKNIRKGLSRERVLDIQKEREFATVYACNLTEAEKTDYRNYQPGLIVIFQKRAKGINKGSRFEIAESSPDGVILISDKGKKIRLQPHLTDSFSVFTERKIGLTENEKIRITANGKTKDGNRLVNGANYTISGFTKGGDIVLNNGSILDKYHAHFTHGYVQTSHASQGKTVDRALVLYSDDGKKAITKEGFYVATSRARLQTTIFTTDKDELKQAIKRSSLRMSATEIEQLQNVQREKVQEKNRLMRFVYRVRKSFDERSKKAKVALQTKRQTPEIAYLQKSVQAICVKPERAVTRVMGGGIRHGYSKTI